MSTSYPSSTPEQSIVMVPVPVDRLSEVYRLLGSPPAQPVAAGTLPGSTWSASDITLLNQVLGPNKAARAILDLGSANPGYPVELGDVSTHVGRSRASVRSELGGFTKLLKSRFGRNDWPFRYALVDGQSLYTVDEEVAGAWLGQHQPGREATA